MRINAFSVAASVVFGQNTATSFKMFARVQEIFGTGARNTTRQIACIVA